MARLQETIPNPTPKVKPEDSTSITMPSEEEQVEEQRVQGWSRKQHYAQYVQVAVELGEDMHWGKTLLRSRQKRLLNICMGLPTSRKWPGA